MAANTIYQFPAAVTGGTVAPTAFQAINQVSASCGWADADTTLTMTHNFGLTAAQNTQGFPNISWNIDAGGAGTAIPIVTFTRNPNTVTLTKASAAGSGGSLFVTCFRPFEPTK